MSRIGTALFVVAVATASAAPARAERPSATAAGASTPAPAAPRGAGSGGAGGGGPPSAPGRPDPETVARAADHFRGALEHYRQGHYQPAIAELEKALELDPTGKDLVFNLGMLHEKTGELPTAIRYYEHFIELEHDPQERDRAERILTRLRGAQAARDVAEAGRPTSVAPRISAPRRVAREVQHVPPTPRQRATYVLAGVSAFGFLAAASFGVVAVLTRPGNSTGEGTSIMDLERDVARSHSYAVAADVSLLVGLAAGIGAGALYLGEGAGAPVAGASPGGVRVRVAF